MSKPEKIEMVKGEECIPPIKIHEWEECILPEELAKDAEFLNRLLDLSSDDRKFFDVKRKSDGKVAIKAKSYVGIFGLKDSKGKDVILVINPKINVTNLVWALAISEDFKEVKEMENQISISLLGKGESNIEQLIISVIRRYLERLSEALTYGFLEIQRTEVEEGTVIRGRILSSLIPKTLFSSPSPRIAYEVQHFTTDNLVNRYILDTGYRLYREKSQLLKAIGVDVNIIFKAMLELSYNPFLSIINDNIHDLFRMIPLDRPYISELLKLAKIIRKWLENEPLSYSKDFVRVPALYINMNHFFESFIRGVVKIAGEQLSETKGIAIEVKKIEENKQSLDIGKKLNIYLKPDIIIEVNGKPVAVGDVKYKDPVESDSDVDNDDVYQVYAYMHGWNVNKGFLIYPSTKNESLHEPYPLKGGKQLYIVKISANKLPETSKDLENSELFNKLLELLKKLIE